MKKYAILILTILLAFFITKIPVSAKEMKLEDLYKEIESFDTEEREASGAYIIGKYVFTSLYGMNTKDIMYAARSIEIDKKSTDKTNELYNKMVIAQINKEGDTWKVASKPYVGSTTLTNETVLNIEYIDYNLLKEETKFDVSLDINDSKYKEILNNYNFDENFDSTDKKYSKDLNLTNNSLKGLIIKNTNIDNTVFPDETRTGYYFPIVINVPDANIDTTIKVEKWSGEKTFTYNDLENDKKTGLVLLISLKPNEQNKKIKITVDLDGDKNIYESKDYEIDWSNVEFPKETTVNITDTIPDEVKTNLLEKNYGYKKTDKDTYKINGNKITGTVYEQVIKDNVFSKEESNNFYFAFNINSNDFKDNATITINGEKNNKTFVKGKDFDGYDSLTLLYAVSKECISKTNNDECVINITVDADGNNPYYIPVNYKIDYSDLNYLHKTKFNITNEINDNSILKNAYGFDLDTYKEKHYDIQIQSTENKVNISGFLPRMKGLTKAFPLDDEKLNNYYYFAYVIHTEEPKNDLVEITVPDNEKTKILKQDAYDTTNDIFMLMKVSPEKENKTFEIKVDMDGESGDNYEPSTITVDYSKIVLENASSATIKVDKETLNSTASEDLKTIEENYGYKIPDDYNISIDENKMLSGTIKKLNPDNVTVFNDEEKTGFYFIYNVNPSEVIPNKTTISIPCKSGNDCKTVENSSIEGLKQKTITLSKDGDSLTVLHSINKETLKKCKNEKDSDNYPNECLIPITVDIDGNDYNYDPYTYNLNIYNLNLIEETVTVNTLEELQDAINNEYVKKIYINDNITLEDTLNISIDRNLTITANDMKKLEMIAEDKDSVISISKGNITFENLEVEGAQTGFKLSDTANVILNNIDVSGNHTSGILVENGTLNATGILDEDEDYDTPVVRATKDATVNLTVGEKNALKHEYKKILKYEDSPSTQQEGDKLDSPDSYVHYYLDENNSKVFQITFKGGVGTQAKAISFVRYTKYNESPEIPETIKYFNAFTDSSDIDHVYTLDGWAKEENPSTKEYDKTDLPKATSDATYYAVYTKTQKEDALILKLSDGINNEELVKKLKQAVSQNSQYNIVILESDIDLGTDALVIEKEGIVIRGRKKENDNTKYKLTGSIEVKANNVSLVNLDINGKKSNNNVRSETDERYYIIKLDESVKKFNLESSHIKNADDTTNAYSALYLPSDNIVTKIRWNEFETDKIYNTIEFGYGNPVGDGTEIYLNDFKGKSDNNHINIYTVQDNANINISSNTFENSNNAIRLSNTTNSTAIFTINYNKYKNTTDDQYQGFLLLQNSKNNDFSKYTIKVYHVIGPDGTYVTSDSTEKERFLYYASDDGLEVNDDNTQLSGKNANVLFDNK